MVNKGSRLIFDMIEEDIIFNSTMSMDLNPLPSNDFEWQDSVISINGVSKKNLKFSEDPGEGVVYHPNHLDQGIWLVNLDDVQVN